MTDALITLVMNILACVALAGGLLFMFTGGLGVARLPDFYSRSHAASKSVTLGIAGLLMGLVLYVAAGGRLPERMVQHTDMPGLANAIEESELVEQAPLPAAATKALLVLVFVVVGAPIGSHMLARAAHIAGVRTWPGTLSDELAEDRSAAGPDGGLPATSEEPAESMPRRDDQ